MHIVHHSSHYSGLSDAMDKAEGLKVLGFFFEVSLPDISYVYIRLHVCMVTYCVSHI